MSSTSCSDGWYSLFTLLVACEWNHGTTYVQFLSSHRGMETLY